MSNPALLTEEQQRQKHKWLSMNIVSTLISLSYLLIIELSLNSNIPGEVLIFVYVFQLFLTVTMQPYAFVLTFRNLNSWRYCTDNLLLKLTNFFAPILFLVVATINCCFVLLVFAFNTSPKGDWFLG